MQVVLRDRWDSLAPLFYLLPLPALAIIAAAVTLVSPGRRSRWSAALLTLGIGLVWYGRCWAPGPDPLASRVLPEEEMRILFWNLNRPKGLCQGAVEAIRAEQPHVAAFVEPGRLTEADQAAWRAALPDYAFDYRARGLLVLSRLPMRLREYGKLDGLGGYVTREFQHPGGTIRLVLADVYAHPFLTRRQQLKEVLEHTEGNPTAIVVGDMNTPRESVHFEAWQPALTPAWEAGGHGWRETWFWGLPLLSLDQMWVGSRWQVVEARKLRGRFSDHSGLTARLRLLPP
ncbi:MAG: hypothetical protein KDK99_11425 [Verrucomicrobiales bacterium]|nr:hypothetical protein [Verrucomicrobiales bacterium]